MKITLALLSILAAMSSAASNRRRRSIIKQAYYSNLFEFTSDVSRKVFETRIELEQNIPEKLKFRHDSFYRKTRTVSLYGDDEMERLNTQYNQLKSFIRRVKSAKSREQNINGKNLSFQFTFIEVKLGNLARMLYRLMRKLRIKIEFKVQPTSPTQVKNTRLQTLTMLKDLEYSLAYMELTFGKAK